jgi:AcrR family transcriptional regulator
LARELKTSRSGFYWHFRDRNELLEEMIEYWRQEYTLVVFKKFQDVQMAPREKLFQAMTMIEENQLNRFEIHMRAWADTDPEVEKTVKEIYRQRLEFIRQIFLDMGFSGCDMEMRARLLLCHLTHGSSMFDISPCDKTEDPLKVRHEILTRR